MFSIFKRTSDRGRKNAPYRIKYKDAEGRWRTKVGCTDKGMTERMAKKLEAEAALHRAGLHDPREARRIEHRRRPLAEHLTDYHRAILAKNGTAKSDGSKHSDSTRTYVKWVASAIKAERIDDLTSSAVQDALASLLAAGKSPRTCNAYQRAVKGFSRWLWRDGRIAVDVLAPLVGYNEATDRRRQRRAFSREELARLIQAAETGGDVSGMTGPDRAMLYRVVVGTGFRAGELRSLTRESFDLTGKPPKVTVEAAYSKNREPSPQPIRHDLAEALRPWIATKAPGCPVFAIPERTAQDAPARPRGGRDRLPGRRKEGGRPPCLPPHLHLDGRGGRGVGEGRAGVGPALDPDADHRPLLPRLDERPDGGPDRPPGFDRQQVAAGGVGSRPGPDRRASSNIGGGQPRTKCAPRRGRIEAD